VKYPQQQHKHQLITDKTRHSGHREAAQAGQQGGTRVLEAKPSVAGEAHKKSNNKAAGIGQFGPHQGLQDRKNEHVGQRRAAAHG